MKKDWDIEFECFKLTFSDFWLLFVWSDRCYWIKLIWIIYFKTLYYYWWNVVHSLRWNSTMKRLQRHFRKWVLIFYLSQKMKLRSIFKSILDSFYWNSLKQSTYMKNCVHDLLIHYSNVNDYSITKIIDFLCRLWRRINVILNLILFFEQYMLLRWKVSADTSEKTLTSVSEITLIEWQS